jgi:hypothetical protein
VAQEIESAVAECRVIVASLRGENFKKKKMGMNRAGNREILYNRVGAAKEGWKEVEVVKVKEDDFIRAEALVCLFFAFPSLLLDLKCCRGTRDQRQPSADWTQFLSMFRESLSPTISK